MTFGASNGLVFSRLEQFAEQLEQSWEQSSITVETLVSGICRIPGDFHYTLGKRPVNRGKASFPCESHK